MFTPPNPAKIQREFFRSMGTVLAACGVDASAWTVEVQKARLFEAIVAQHKSDIQQEWGITLDVWTHAADLQKYAAEQGYLGDASYMSGIEGQLRTNALRGPKLVLSNPVQPAVRPPVVEEHSPVEERKEAAEAAEVVIQPPAAMPQVPVVEKPAEEPVAPDYQKILELMEEYRANQLAKLETGQETAEAVERHLAAYWEIEENVRLKAAGQSSSRQAVKARP